MEEKQTLRETGRSGARKSPSGVEMKIRGLMMDPSTNMPIVVLKDLASDAVMPIWVGIFEANAIAIELEKLEKNLERLPLVPLVGRALLRRELADRFSGSVFGWAWAVVGPLITLLIYTMTFTKAMQLPLASARGGTSCYALSTFLGLIIFSLFAELCGRAPLLMHEHAWFLKTSIFPSETLAWTAVLRALTYAVISFLVLLVF